MRERNNCGLQVTAQRQEGRCTGRWEHPLTLHVAPAAGKLGVMWDSPGCSALAVSPSSLPHFPHQAWLGWPWLEMFSILVLSQNRKDQNWQALTSPCLVTEQMIYSLLERSSFNFEGRMCPLFRGQLFVLPFFFPFCLFEFPLRKFMTGLCWLEEWGWDAKCRITRVNNYSLCSQIGAPHIWLHTRFLHPLNNTIWLITSTHTYKLE